MQAYETLVEKVNKALYDDKQIENRVRIRELMEREFDYKDEPFISIQDILQVLHKHREGGDFYYLCANGWLMRDCQTHEGHREGQMVCKFDLSKSIKDQEESVLLKLIELIK